MLHFKIKTGERYVTNTQVAPAMSNRLIQIGGVQTAEIERPMSEQITQWLFRCLHGFWDMKVPAYAIKKEGSLFESFGVLVGWFFLIWPDVE